PGPALDLRAVLAGHYGVSPDQLVLGNGSNDTLLQAFLVFGGHGRRVLLFQPTYSMHERLTTITGGTVVNERIGWPYEVTRARARRDEARQPRGRRLHHAEQPDRQRDRLRRYPRGREGVPRDARARRRGVQRLRRTDAPPRARRPPEHDHQQDLLEGSRLGRPARR